MMPPVDVAISLQLHSPTTCHHHPPNQPRTAPSATFAPSPSPHVHRIYTESVFSRSLALSLSTGGLSVCLSLTPHPSSILTYPPTFSVCVPFVGLLSRALYLFFAPTHPVRDVCTHRWVCACPSTSHRILPHCMTYPLFDSPVFSSKPSWGSSIKMMAPSLRRKQMTQQQRKTPVRTKSVLRGQTIARVTSATTGGSRHSETPQLEPEGPPSQSCSE